MTFLCFDHLSSFLPPPELGVFPQCQRCASSAGTGGGGGEGGQVGADRNRPQSKVCCAFCSEIRASLIESVCGRFHEHVKLIDDALKDNIDTKSACDEIRRLISAANIYMQQKQNTSNPNLLRNIARFITDLMNTFGCGAVDEPIGFPALNSNTTNDREEQILPYVEVIAALREEIRHKAKELKNKELFALCDRIRDDILPELGVRMEDYETESGLKSRLKFVDKETLMREREERIKAEELKRLAKEEKKTKQTKPVEVPIPPQELFLKDKDKYSQFDQNGMPTHDAAGQELTKSALKKLAKIYQSQEKKYKDYISKHGTIGGDQS